MWTYEYIILLNLSYYARNVKIYFECSLKYEKKV